MIPSLAICHRGITVSCLILFSGVMVGCRQHDEHAGSVEPTTAGIVKIERVSAQEGSRGIELTGRIRSRHRVVIESQLMARIRTLDLVEGQAVEKGSAVVVLDDVELQARVDRANALAESAESDLKRAVSLLAQAAISQQEYDHQVAEAGALRATANELQVMLGYTRLTAPFPGVVAHKYASVGEMATPGKPLLAIDDPLNLQFEIMVPESLMAQIHVSQVLPIRVPAALLSVTGRVVEVSSAADPNTHSFRVVLDIATAETLRVGQSGRITVPSSQPSLPLVPATALIQRGQMHYVFVVEAGHARLRIVRTGRRVGDALEILAGLDVGEHIISAPPAALREGQAVESEP